MGICFSREKDGDDYLRYEGRYVYCETCLAKIKYNNIYVMAHCQNHTKIFCSRECYGYWLVEP